MSGIIQALVGGFGGKNASVTYVTEALSTTASGTQTFSNVPIGNPDPNRIVVVCVGIRSANVSHTITSLTLAGTAMTSAVTSSAVGSGTAYHQVTTRYLAYPTGTTANIVVTINNQSQSCYIAVYSLVGTFSVGSVATDTTATSNAYSVTSNTTAGGTTIAVVCSTGTGSQPKISSSVGFSQNGVGGGLGNTYAVSGNSFPTTAATGATQSVNLNNAVFYGVFAVANFSS